MAGANDEQLEIGHVLFIDIVGYSRLLIEDQKERLHRLTAIVLATAQVRETTNEQLVRLPTGDGMALVFRTSSEQPVRCAFEIASALKSHPKIQIRMGIPSGPVSEVIDLNERTNIAGAGINMAHTTAIVLSCAFTMAPQASAQLSFTFVSGSPTVGVPFTIGISYNFTTAGSGLPNFAGFSLWLVNTGSAALTMTDRQIGASLFGDLQTSNFNLFGGAMGGGIPEILDPINRQGFGTAPSNQINTDIGALTTNNPVGNGTYFLCNVTFVATSVGSFGIANTTAATPNVGGRISVITDSNGNTVTHPVFVGWCTGAKLDRSIVRWPDVGKCGGVSPSGCGAVIPRANLLATTPAGLSC